MKSGKRVLITGITGFAGSHLADYLLENGYDVYGIARCRSKMENIEHIKDRVTLVNADIKDGYSLIKVFKDIRPDYCFHLAAQSFVLESWNSPLETMSNNALGTINVLEAIRQSAGDCLIQLAGSSEEYGLVYPDETPIKETNPLRPMSPYGVSKVATDKLGCLYYMSYNLHVVVTRAFNHSGPRRGEVFATSNFAKQIAEIEAHKKEPILRVGNLEARRDWTDVRDVVRAYWLAITKCKPGEAYNICSGRTWTIKGMLNILLSCSNIDIKIEQDESRLRPSDVPILLGNCDKFKQTTGWKQEIPFDKTLLDLLSFWRDRV